MKTYVCLIIAVTATLVAANKLYPVDPIPGIKHALPRVPVAGIDEHALPPVPVAGIDEHSLPRVPVLGIGPAGPLGFPYRPSRPGSNCPQFCPQNYDPQVAICYPGGRTVFSNFCAFQRDACLSKRRCVLINPKKDLHFHDRSHY